MPSDITVMQTASRSRSSNIESPPGYLAHFGLNCAPFSPDNLPFFAGGNRGATLDGLLYALTHDEALIKLTGENGSGKSTLLRLLAQRLPESVACLYVSTGDSLSEDGLLNALAKALALENAHDALPVVTRHLLHEHLSERNAHGLLTIALIDDAHRLTPSALEEIALLSAHNGSRGKTILFVLSGSPELNSILAHDHALPLKERITHNFTLDALTPDEAAAYLDLRLRAAGQDGASLIESTTAHLLGAAASGSIRQINLLADQALQTACTGGHPIVGHNDIPDLPHNIPLASITTPQKRKNGKLYGGLLIIAALIGGGFSAYRLQPEAAPLNEPTPAPLAAQQHPIATPPASAPAITATPEIPEQTPVPSEASTESLTRQRLDAGTDWLKHAQRSHWFIQINAMDADQTEQIESFLQKLADDLPPEQTRAYLGKRDGIPRIGIIYGDFANQADALRALSALPSTVRDNQPYIRQVNKLK
ncbi:MAG TPA: AAA family ATPase [Rhodocyclaceae bacterium]|nr:AAA family ATPase [Rhodocyclaceae bacterium]